VNADRQRGAAKSRGGARTEDNIFAQRRVHSASEAPAVLRATDLTGVLILKHDQLFLLSDAFGDVRQDNRGLGLYQSDTRMLSQYEMRLNGSRPVILRTGSAASYRSELQLTNPDLLHVPDGLHDEEVVLRRHQLGILRERIVAGGFAERISIENFTTRPERARLTLSVDADFADIFEIRGVVRERRGDRLANSGNGSHVVLAYRGLDGALRRTHVQLTPTMTPLHPAARVRATGELAWHGDGAAELAELPADGPVLLMVDWHLSAGAREVLEVKVWGEVTRPRGGRRARTPPPLSQPLLAQLADPPSQRRPEPAPPMIELAQAEAMHRAWRQSSAQVETTHLFAQRALTRAMSDLRLLLNTGPGEGERYIAAGVPWFSCLFGRDALIASMQLLSVRPQLAQQTLEVLARLQATEVDDWRDAQPGKILHELRSGELAMAGEIPHTPYYGTVDATPLWLMLLDEYQRWTGDDALVEQLWPNAMAALRWIDEFGDADGDGFVEYVRRSPHGLLNQGWKDSGDAVRHQDGRLGEPPTALVEVQAYVYAARLGVARLARRRGQTEIAEREEAEAERLRVRFEEQFWLDEAGTYALALDGNKRPVDAIASNAGHALWCGIASVPRARSVARVLTGPDMWSGWGIRTLASTAVGYNPIGYHVGTIWPHDNGICAAGFARYGLHDEARLLAGVMLEATTHFRDARLPELFCGFERQTSPLPVPYPVACSPQAWAAGSLFHLVTSTLGLRPDASARRLDLVAPSLPDWLPELHIDNLRIGEAIVDLSFAAHDGSIPVEVRRRTGDLEIVVRL
jgi:glycogen debranching enzyme